MYRNFILALVFVLVAVAPVWGYSSGWTFGPFIAVLFLLGVNLINFLFIHPDEGGQVSALDRQRVKS